MRKMILSAALACLTALLVSDVASACHRGCGGGHHGGCGGGCGWSGGCGGGCGWGGGSCGGGVASCGGGYCYAGGGYAGGYAYGGPVVGGYAVAPSAAPATLVVNLPADAVLTIDGERTASTSAERVFRTPELESGRDFEYTLQAKVVRDGKEKVVTQRVTVRAGEQTSVRLEVPATAAAE